MTASRPTILLALGLLVVLTPAALLPIHNPDFFWHIAPSPWVTKGIETGAFHIDWLDFAAPIAIGGIWLWAFFGQLASRPIVPARDPYFEGAVEHGHGH